jgi:hypothetical protein
MTQQHTYPQAHDATQPSPTALALIYRTQLTNVCINPIAYRAAINSYALTRSSDKDNTAATFGADTIAAAVVLLKSQMGWLLGIQLDWSS